MQVALFAVACRNDFVDLENSLSWNRALKLFEVYPNISSLSELAAAFLELYSITINLVHAQRALEHFQGPTPKEFDEAGEIIERLGLGRDSLKGKTWIEEYAADPLETSKMSLDDARVDCQDQLLATAKAKIITDEGGGIGLSVFELVLQSNPAVSGRLLTISAKVISKLTATNRGAFYRRFGFGPKVQDALKKSMANLRAGAASTNATTAAAKLARALTKAKIPRATIELLMAMDRYDRAQHLDDTADQVGIAEAVALVMALPFELDRIQTLIEMETYDAISKLLLPALRRFTDQITSHGITLISDSEAQEHSRQAKRKTTLFNQGCFIRGPLTLSEAKELIADKELYSMSSSAADQHSEAAMLEEADAHDRKENLKKGRKRESDDRQLAKKRKADELDAEGGTSQAPAQVRRRLQTPVAFQPRLSSRTPKPNKPHEAQDQQPPCERVCRKN